jgi:Tfp pilus assembly protein PilF
MTKPLPVLLLMLLFSSVLLGVTPVVVKEEPLNIPTWEIGPPAIHPVFEHQGGPVYPYMLNETLTDKKVDGSYQAVTMENEYVRLLILPEIGGRLHGAEDKTNGYVWLYWQRTIKPGLISMTGAWISGGIEWNFPHGHRPSGFMTVDHRVVRHPDGSATVWVGETEPIYRMRWLVGITMEPGRSHVKCQYIFINPTDHKQPFQFWATASTHANENAQAQYPGDMVTGHGKHEFWNWPVDKGIDLTWWKNVLNASSYFAFNNPSDWFGAYDHKAQGGMVHVANHNIMPGKKLWTWGSGPSGRIWEDILSEGGGPYYEPQAGAWSDNQPDYHWMSPHEVKTTADYWWPVRDSRGYHNASKDFAVNTDLRDGKAFAAVCASGVFDNYRVVFKNTRTGKILKEGMETLAPDKPFTTEVAVDSSTSVYDLHLAVYDSSGKIAIEVQQKPPQKVDLPPGQKDPGDPKKMTQDQLYHSAEWLDKFVRKNEGTGYYEEAIKKDPGDSRVNIELSFRALKQGRWQDALNHLNKAQERDYDNSRIYFGKGLAFTGLGKLKEAADQFYRATYTYDYFAPSYLNIARLDLRQGNFADALAHASESQLQNGRFADIPALKASIYRHLGKHAEALQSAELAMDLDPMHFMGGYEKVLALRNLGKSASEWEAVWKSVMRGAVQNLLELACAYANAGLYGEADELLADFASGKKDAELYPMVSYLRGYYKELQGDKNSATSLYGAASRGPAIYTNPHRLEEKNALEAALQSNPQDSRAHLYLGNLLYALGQRPEGLSHWKKASQLDGRLSLAWRNLGYGELLVNKNVQESSADYRRVMELDPRDGRALLEWSQVFKGLKMPLAEQLTLLDRYPEAVDSRDDLAALAADLRLENGSEENLRKVEEILNRRHFHSWEGGYGIHESWVELYQKLGDKAFARKDYSSALSYYKKCFEYPGNLEVAPRSPDFKAHLLWNMFKIYRATGRSTEAQSSLKEILAEKYNKPHLGTYYQALAQKELKNTGAYQALLTALEKQAQENNSGKSEYRSRQEGVGHYLLSLVLDEKGEKENATAELNTALSQNSMVRRAAVLQAQLDAARAHQ